MTWTAWRDLDDLAEPGEQRHRQQTVAVQTCGLVQLGAAVKAPGLAPIIEAVPTIRGQVTNRSMVLATLLGFLSLNVERRSSVLHAPRLVACDRVTPRLGAVAGSRWPGSR